MARFIYRLFREESMAEKKLKDKEITVNGYLEEIELETGRSGVMVYDGEDDYCVVMDKSGKQLLEHINEEVEVTGILSKKGEDLILRVTRFRPVDYYEDMGDDDFFNERWSI